MKKNEINQIYRFDSRDDLSLTRSYDFRTLGEMFLEAGCESKKKEYNCCEKAGGFFKTYLKMALLLMSCRLSRGRSLPFPIAERIKGRNLGISLKNIFINFFQKINACNRL